MAGPSSNLTGVLVKMDEDPDTQTKGRACEDTVGRRLSSGKAGRSQKRKLTLLIPSSWTSSFQNCQKMNLGGLSPHSVLYVMVAPAAMSSTKEDTGTEPPEGP